MSEGFVVTEVRYDDVASRKVGHLCALVEEVGELVGVDVLFCGNFDDLSGILSTVNSQRSTVAIRIYLLTIVCCLLSVVYCLIWFKPPTECGEFVGVEAVDFVEEDDEAFVGCAAHNAFGEPLDMLGYVG